MKGLFFAISGSILRVDFFERLLVESGAHLPGVRQLFAIVKPQHQRAEVIALAVRESADDESSGRYHFDLDPIAAAPSFVFASARFGHDAFQPVGARGFEHRVAIHGEEIGNVNAFGGSHDFRQQALAFFERHSAQIVAVQIQQIEQETGSPASSGKDAPPSLHRPPRCAAGSG